MAKTQPDGTALVYATYLGGGADPDEGLGIAVDTAGDATSPGLPSRPTLPRCIPCNPRSAVALDAFVAKLIPSRIVNDLVTFVPIESTFNNTPVLLIIRTPCPSDFVGEFSFSARLTHKDVDQAFLM